MDSFDFHSLDHDAFEQTMAYFKANPEPQPIDDDFTSYRAMMGDTLEEKDWLEEMQEELKGDELAGIDTQMHASQSNPRLKMLPCTWAGCEQSFSEPEMAAHLIGHGDAATLQFHAPSSCVWSGCSSKAIFKRMSLYRHHLKNIHIKPLICTVAKCSYKKPFRDQDDLDRHSATSHSEVKNYHCPYHTCDAETKQFARRDKWLKHIQETIHENDAFCPYYHCALEQASASGKFKDRKQISRHFGSIHARNGDESYECALRSCAKATFPSYWSKTDLERHLRKDHGVPYHSAWIGANYSAKQERVLEVKHLVACRPTEYHDCTVCSSMGTKESTSAAPGYHPLPDY